MNKFTGLILFTLFTSSLWAQKATVTGKVMNEEGDPIEAASVYLKDLSNGVKTNEKGEYSLEVPAEENVIIVFSALNYEKKYITKYLKKNQVYPLTISLGHTSKKLREFEKVDKSTRSEAGMIQLDPKKAELLPGPLGGIEGLLKIFVNSNNELSSQYNVRGGNYDENLVYINDFEVYRPFLVRSGQQEGLSIINADLVRNVNFSTGGFQAKYGDKMSSALDITYKRPKSFGGSFSLSLLGVNAHLEGVGMKNRLSYLIGVRQKSNQYLLQSQQTKGIYNPSFTDLQAFINYRLTPKWEMDIFANYARNRFDFQPEESTQSFGVINRAFQLKMYYQGSETDKFDSRYGGISFTNTPNTKTTYKFIASGFQTNETETYDILGEYLLGEIETDLGKETFGQLKYAIGTGIIHNYARNYLKINVGNIGHKGAYDAGKHFIQWGVNSEFIAIQDKLAEWERRDSAGFSQPYSDSILYLFKNFNSTANLNYQRLTAYVQDNIALDSLGVVINAGIRANYSLLNKELLISPRIQLSYKPIKWKKDVMFKLAGGLYHQPPFYREMRDFDGNINTKEKAQRSFHAVAGFDYHFKGLHSSPFKLSLEAYYKKMWNLVPYEFDNVRIRYFGDNLANGYAYGADLRLFGDIVKDAESWVSVGLLKTEEDILNDEIIIKSEITGQDSITYHPGYIPRPTDSRLRFGIYFADYLPKNDHFKLYLNGIYGTGLPFGPPDRQRYADTLRIPSYKRVDIGFAAQLLDGAKKERPYYSMFRKMESIWLSVEVFNLLGIRNTLSYLWIQDQTSERVYAVPNRLTSRLLNAKLIVKF